MAAKTKQDDSMFDAIRQAHDEAERRANEALKAADEIMASVNEAIEMVEAATDMVSDAADHLGKDRDHIWIVEGRVETVRVSVLNDRRDVACAVAAVAIPWAGLIATDHPESAAVVALGGACVGLGIYLSQLTRKFQGGT